MLRRHFLKRILRRYLARYSLFRTDKSSTLNSIAFGSCNRTHLPQPLWSHIISRQPDIFLWLGDAVYADTTDPEKMQREYQKQLSMPDYIALRNSTPVVGIWDDHDYGGNNLGKENPIRQQSQQLFLDFVDEPADSARRAQKGVYTSYVFGAEAQQVKLILLDTRYHRERPGKGRANLLGKAQWRWLENELKTTTAQVNLIASSFSVLSTQIPRAEEWDDYQWEKRRLFRLIKKHRVSGVLFLTGDRHFAAHLSEKASGRRYHELMSSGMTHYLKRSYISRLFKHYYGVKNSYFGINFSVLEFDWSDPVRIRFCVYDKNNTLQLERRLSLIDGFWSI